VSSVVRPHPPLVLLAAGMGTRFGGIKPLAPVGPQREPLIGIALDQAVDAGFDSVVVVVGGASRVHVEATLARWPTSLTITTVSQDGIGPPRTKPWGTVGALVAVHRAGDWPTGCVLANGDDLYGAAGLRLAHDWLVGDAAAPGQAEGAADGALIAYRADRTLSSHGGVSRALPIVDEQRRLVSLAEQRDVRWHGATIESASGAVLAPDTPVSMNLWALRPSMIGALTALFEVFLADNVGNENAECGLPDAIGSLLAGTAGPGPMAIDLLVTESTWHGVTWADDVERVRADLVAELEHRDASR